MYPYGFGAQPAPQVGAQPEVRERKRKWDVPGVQEQPPAPPPGLQPELALQNAATRLNQMLANRGMSTVHAFEKKVDVNNCKPETRYYLCRGTTHEEIGRATQAALRVRGRYKDPHDTSADEALHLFVTAPTQVQLDQAIRMIDDIIKRDQVRGPGAQAGNFQGKCVVGLENAEPVFGLHGRILGPKGAYLKHIQSTANCKVTLKGRGSGFFEQNTGQEAPEPLYLHVQAGTKADFEQAKQLTEDLLSTIRSDYYSQFGGMPRGPTPPGPQQGFAAPPAPQPFRQPYATPIAPPGPPAPGPAAFPPPAYPPAPYGAAVPPPPPGYPYPYPPPSYPPYGYPPGYPPAPIPPPGPPGYAPPPQYPPYPPQPVQQPVAQPPQHPPPQQLQQPPQQLQPQPPVPRRFQERVAEVEPAVPVPRRFQEAPQQRTLWGDSAEEEAVDDRTFGPERSKGGADGATDVDSFYRDIGMAPAAAVPDQLYGHQPQHASAAAPRKSVSFNPAPQVELFDKEEGIEARRGFFTPTAKALRMDGGGRIGIPMPEPEPEPEQARVILEEDEPAFKLVDYGEEDAEPPSPPRAVEPPRPPPRGPPAPAGPGPLPFWASRG
eukprot:TRINITY_DN370_c0_g1_i3.p1 TRINITY_DN370_c0_g1~~TRINITY_DN370_c0_g1_i3.p1  ORF type:complete len:604 (+),score=108.35 TRINITY_DN370_c0_g1_i3:13-1824(+)